MPKQKTLHLYLQVWNDPTWFKCLGNVFRVILYFLTTFIMLDQSKLLGRWYEINDIATNNSFLTRWQISVRSAPLKPWVTLATYPKSTSCQNAQNV